MRDHDAGAPFQQTFQRDLNPSLGIGIDVRRRFVEDQDGRVRDQRAGEAQKLPLAERQVTTLLIEHRVVAVGELNDEVVRPDDPGGALDVLAGGVFGRKPDVVENRPGEQIGILEHHRDVTAERRPGVFTDVVSVDAHAPLPDIVEPVEKRGDAGLSRAGRPHQRHRFARRNRQVQPVEHGLAGVVTEGHVLKRDRAAHALGRQRPRLVDDGEGNVQHLEDPLPRGHRALHDAVLDGERTDRVEEALDVEHEGDHHAHFQRAVEHQRPSQHDDDGERRAGQGVDDRYHYLGESGRPQMGAEVFRRLVAVEHEVHALAAHALDGADGVDRLGQGAVGDGVGLARPAESDAGARQPDHADHGQRRNQHQCQQTELQMKRQHDDDDADQQQEVAQGGDRVLQELL